MRTIWAAATAAMLICAVTPAKAESNGAADKEPAIGVGVICNTSEQAEHFVSLRTKGTEPKQAMDAVNAATQEPRACGLAAIAFTRDQTVDTKTVGNKLVQIVRINVIAGFNGNAWQRVTGMMIQYAVMEGEGETI